MTLKPLTSCLVVLSLCACGQGTLPMEDVPSEPTRVTTPAPIAAATPSAQRFALTSSSTDGWSLSQHTAVAPTDADFTFYASGCRGSLINQISSTRFTFCKAGSNFGSLNDVPGTVSDCAYPSYSLSAGGSYGNTAIGDGYVVFKEGVHVGQLRIVDHTLVPQSWDGQPVQVTLEFVATTSAMP